MEVELTPRVLWLLKLVVPPLIGKGVVPSNKTLALSRWGGVRPTRYLGFKSPLRTWFRSEGSLVRVKH